jgi:hypothetical protein
MPISRKLNGLGNTTVGADRREEDRAGRATGTATAGLSRENGQNARDGTYHGFQFLRSGQKTTVSESTESQINR